MISPLGSLGQALTETTYSCDPLVTAARTHPQDWLWHGPTILLGEGPYKRKCSFHTGFRVLLLTSVTWMHLASGLPRLAPLRKLKRCSLCGPGSRGVPEAGRMPSMQ